MICDSHLDWSNVQPAGGNILIAPIIAVARDYRVAVFSLHTEVSFVNDHGYRETHGHTNCFDEGERRMITARDSKGTPITFEVEGDILTITIGDKTTRVPLRAFDRLRDATEGELGQFEIISEGEGIRWPALDEDLHVPSLLEEFGRR